MPIDEIQKRVLRTYPRAIVHMRERLQANSFGMVLGAGVSKALDFPDWATLVDRIASHPRVDAKHLICTAISASATEKTQMLLQHYRAKRVDEIGEGRTARALRLVHGEWQQVITSALYDGVESDAEELKNAHPYLASFLPTILKSPMTVTYNFDDVLERLLSLEIQDAPTSYGRPFETVWDAAFQPRRNGTIVYHPNGYLPSNLLEEPSENIVFSQDSFADQLIESMAGHHSSLLHHFTRTTCLLMGLSLDDQTLRHLLRQNARINPGQCHYFVHWIDDSETRDEEVEQALSEANFEVSNLVTLFLTNEECDALGKLLTLDENELCDLAEEEGVSLKYVYYLTGAVGAGKTTVVNYLGSLQVYEEWTEPRHSNLAQSWKVLSVDERDELDAWILGQFVKKDHALRHAKPGIHIVDRPPLDPLSFTDLNLVGTKAVKMLESFCPGAATRKIEQGQIILLHGEPTEMETRIVGRHKRSDSSVISDLQIRLEEIYEKPVVIETAGRPVHAVVKEVAKIVHLDRFEYRPYSLQSRLKELSISCASLGGNY